MSLMRCILLYASFVQCGRSKAVSDSRMKGDQRLSESTQSSRSSSQPKSAGSTDILIIIVPMFHSLASAWTGLLIVSILYIMKHMSSPSAGTIMVVPRMVPLLLAPPRFTSFFHQIPQVIRLRTRNQRIPVLINRLPIFILITILQPIFLLIRQFHDIVPPACHPGVSGLLDFVISGWFGDTVEYLFNNITTCCTPLNYEVLQSFVFF